MTSEAPDDDAFPLRPVEAGFSLGALPQGCRRKESAMLCGLPPERAVCLLERPEVQRAVRHSYAKLGEIVRRMDLAALRGQPADSNVVDLWAWVRIPRANDTKP